MTDPNAGQMRMDEVWGGKAEKYFIADTTSAKDLRRS